MIIWGYRVPLFASLILWAAIWEFMGQMGATLVMPPLSAVLVPPREPSDRRRGALNRLAAQDRRNREGLRAIGVD